MDQSILSIKRQGRRRIKRNNERGHSHQGADKYGYSKEQLFSLDEKTDMGDLSPFLIKWQGCHRKEWINGVGFSYHGTDE